jgi:hypothetical protein
MTIQKTIKGGDANPTDEKLKTILGNSEAGLAAQKAKQALAEIDAAEAERLKKEAAKKKSLARKACCGCCGDW